MALTKKEINAGFRKRRKEQGLCIDCGGKLDRDGIRCDSCNEKIKKCNREMYAWRQGHKICPKCKVNDLFGDEKVCLECNARNYAITMRSRERLGKEHVNKVHKEWAKNEHQKRIEKGVCTRCGKRKADKGFKTCGICRQKERNKYLEKRYRKNDYDTTRYERGICHFCDNPVKKGYKVCEKHYQLSIKNLDNPKRKEATERMKKSNNMFFKKRW